jgi:DNA polymerase/3'-5' exonuclease PolX
MNKKDLAKQFNDLADKETNPFKKRAYAKASLIIADMSEEEFNNRAQFKDIDGIGEAIDKKILQFKETGFIEKWKELFAGNSV